MRLFLAFVLLSFSGFAQVTTGLKFTQLTDDLYVYTNYKFFSGTQFPSNSMYMVTDEGVVLFDTPWDENQFQPLLDSIKKRHNKKVVLCIATHFHDDSSAGLEYYSNKGIKTYTSKMTYDLTKTKNTGSPAKYTFEKDTVFNIGGRVIETYYPGEGHTKDNIVLYVKDEKVVYGGCLIKSTEAADLGNIADANVNEWEQTMKNLMNKYPNPVYVIPGHFAWSKGDESIRYTIKLIKETGKE
ncbi:BlaB/IND/MUS family subclass B1 metallo-beta-lactamase [Flavobacterium sp.]|uniref:BlaB/IND/MUS family subclass B1 metallo-beta-lactamase n=1 Tax=Flavobacterium sp. TaxID=239 RepID=UPI003A931C46